MAVDKPKPARGEEPVTEVRVITGDYFKAMGIPLLRGPQLHHADASAAGGHTLIVNETLARQMWPGEDPIGKQLRINWDDPQRRRHRRRRRRRRQTQRRAMRWCGR